MGSGPEAEEEQAQVSVESGERLVDGERIRYDLYTPSGGEALGNVLFLHGFAGGRAALARHARAVAARGAAALAVDLSSLTRGGSFREVWIERSVRSAQLRNVRQAVDHALWLGPRPCALVGHSAGGAVALEAAVALQEAGRPPAALVLLDAVPFEGTSAVAERFDLGATRLVSVRAEPSVWNKQGGIAEALARVPEGPPGRLVDLRLRGAKHGDPMEPSLALRLAGVLGAGHEAFARLAAAHLGRALALPGGEAPEEALVELRRAEQEAVEDLGASTAS